MERKEFIRNCGFTCAGILGLSVLLEGCTGARHLTGKIVADDLVLSADDFSDGKGGYLKSLVVRNEILQYPVCIYRHSEVLYSALWMQCTHQGAELQVFGDTLQCPAHGSEFNSSGAVQNGPADRRLRSFPVTIVKDRINISLKVA